MYNLYAWLGRVLYRISKPASSKVLSHTFRAYALIKNSKGEILVVKNWLSLQQWRLPGGGLTARDSILKGLERELHEELGLDLSSLRPISIHLGKTRHYPFAVVVYENVINLEIKSNRLEITDYSWLDIDVTNDNQVSEQLDVILKLLSRK